MTTGEMIIQLAGLITAVAVITGAITVNLKRWLSKEIKDLKMTVRDMDYNSCKNYLTDFLTDKKNGKRKSDVQEERACEVWEHYKYDLKGNSFIERDWDTYMCLEKTNK